MRIFRRVRNAYLNGKQKRWRNKHEEILYQTAIELHKPETRDIAEKVTEEYHRVRKLPPPPAPRGTLEKIAHEVGYLLAQKSEFLGK